MACYGTGCRDGGLPDITAGNNTVSFSQDGKSYAVKCYTAVKGYDPWLAAWAQWDWAKLVGALAAAHP